MKHEFDAIIIGAGPAGCSAALWLKQLGLDPILLEKNSTCGGLQLSNPYTNTWIATSANVYGKDVAQSLHQNMLDHRVNMMLGVSASKAQVTSTHVEVIVEGKCITGKYLVLATGTQFKTGGYGSRAGLIIGPGLKVNSTDFKGKKVAILGGGDSAFENFDFIKNRGASDVQIFARSLRARPEMVERAPLDCIHLGNIDFNGDSNTINGIAFDEVLVLYGYEANKSGLLGLEPALTHEGFVVTDHYCFTTIERVMAIGEIARRAHPCCVTAMADGVIAAKAIQAKLESNKRDHLIGAIKRGTHLLGKVLARS